MSNSSGMSAPKSKTRVLTLWSSVLAAILLSPPAVWADTYRLKVTADVEKGILVGSESVRYRNDSTTAIDEIRFRLDPNMGGNESLTIASVSDGEGKTLRWRWLPFRFGKMESSRGQMAVELSSPIAPGDEQLLKLDFELNDRRFINPSMLTLQDDPFHSFDAWYVKAMTRRGERWSIDDDRPSDYDVTIDLSRDGGQVASTGKLVSAERLESGRTRLHLQAKNVRGFTVYSSPDWVARRRVVDGRVLTIHLPKATASDWADKILDAAADTLKFYDREYGRLPGDSLSIICLGSMTGPPHGSSATCNGVTLWLNSKFSENYQVHLAHEIAHQYFGSLVGISRNEISWAPMGLGMIMDSAYMRDRGLDDRSTRSTIQWFYFEALRRKYDTSLSISVDSAMRDGLRWNMPLMHGKAYEVCRMLQDLVGEKQFRDIIRHVIKEKRRKVLRGQDLIGYCEEALGTDLKWFEDAWIQGDGSLDYAVKDVKGQEKQHLVVVSQLGEASFPIVVEATTSDGRKLRKRIDRTRAENRLVFPAEALRSVVLDPGQIAPDTDRSNNTWMHAPPGGAKSKDR